MTTALRWVGATNDEADLSGDRLGAVADDDLLAVMPALVQVERSAVADVVEHLMEIDRRRLYLRRACSSLFAYCRERLGYSEYEALARVRAARAAARFPVLLDELRRGGLHLTGIFLLSTRLTDANHAALVDAARGKSKSQIEAILAQWFPKPDVPAVLLGPATWSGGGTLAGTGKTGAGAGVASETDRGNHGTGGGAVGGLAGGTWAGKAGTGGTGAVSGLAVDSRSAGFGAGGSGGAAEALGDLFDRVGRLRPLSASRWALQLTARAELVAKIEQARELLSHAVPSGDLAELVERAFDALLERETKRRMGAGKPRKRRELATGSRHVPVEVARRVWERDGGQCTYVDERGRRCSARRFVTIEHRTPHACGGPPTARNLCLLCAAHNAESARRVFGDSHIRARIAARKQPGTGGGEGGPAESPEHRRTADEPSDTGAPDATDATDATEKVSAALRLMGFRQGEIRRALAELRDGPADIEALLRAALERLTTGA